MLFSLLLIIFLTSTAAEDTTKLNNNRFGICPLSLFDLTINKDTTDSVKLLLVIGNGLTNYHIYNISKAASVVEDKLFKKNYKTVIYLHGYNDSPSSALSLAMIYGYQLRKGYNIILIDYSHLASAKTLIRGNRLVRYIGVRLALLLTQLSRVGLNMAKFEMVGFSMGANVAGFTAKNYYKYSKKKLPLIISLDGSNSCHKNDDPDDRLNVGDANYIIAIHTYGAGAGTMSPRGNIDFYINGGSRQPSASAKDSNARAVYIWKYALINPKKFVGVKCESMKEVERNQCFKKGRPTANIGPDEKKNKGLYYVKTSNQEPYYLSEP